MVECVRPEPGKHIADPGCGTGGFFLAAYDLIANEDNFKLDKPQKEFLKYETFHGNEIVANTRRLCLMNMLLHNIGEIDGAATVSPNDSLVADAGVRFDYVLANPPFGKKSSMTFNNEEGEQEKDDLTYNRQDFWASTSNNQLNFVQHIRTTLKAIGCARGPLAELRLRGTDGPRQDQLRRLLTQGQEPGRFRKPARTGRTRRTDHREPGG